MNRVSTIERFISPTTPLEDDLVDEHQGEGDYRAFGITRKTFGSETMLDLVLKTGDHQTFAYTHLYRMAFNPSEGISLYFTDHVIELLGQRLKELYRYFRSHRVTFVCEADSPTVQSCTDAEAVISSILIRPIDPRIEADSQ